jgi:hypothetical protein
LGLNSGGSTEKSVWKVCGTHEKNRGLVGFERSNSGSQPSWFLKCGLNQEAWNDRHRTSNTTFADAPRQL